MKRTGLCLSFSSFIVDNFCKNLMLKYFILKKCCAKQALKQGFLGKKFSFVFWGGLTLKDTTKAFEMMYNPPTLMECCKIAVKLKISLNWNNDVFSMITNFLANFTLHEKCSHWLFWQYDKTLLTQKLFLLLVLKIYFCWRKLCGVRSHWCGAWSR